MHEYLPCEVAKVELLKTLSQINPERVYNMLLWLSQQFHPDGSRAKMNNSTMHDDLPRHFDCEFWDECCGDEGHCRKRQ